MRIRQIVEAPEDDIEAAEQARWAASQVSHAIYDRPDPDHWVELGDGHGDFYVYTPRRLGLVERFPWMATVCVMLGRRLPNTIGDSGAVYRFEGADLYGMKRAIAIRGMEEMSAAGARSLANSVSFLSTFRHEFIHMLDNIRTGDRIVAASSHDKAAYYNSPAEFNAYFHDVVNKLMGVVEGVRRGDSAKDYADLYEITGDFWKDLQHMTRWDFHNRTFMQWLRDDRRKALLRRVYKLHSMVMGLIRADESARAGKAA